MGTASKTRLIVKHTFLEMVLDDESPIQKRNRSFTDGAIYGRESQDREACNMSSVEYIVQGALEQELAEQAELVPVGERQAPDNVSHCLFMAQQALAMPTPASSSPHVALLPGLPVAADGQPTMMMMAQMVATPMGPTACFVPMMAIPTQVMQAAIEPTRGNHSGLVLPRRGSAKAHVPAFEQPDEFTTLMLRNLPNQYTRDMLVEMLNREGFAQKFRFVYLPIDFKTHAGLGYAFVDLTTGAEANRMLEHFEGFSRWAVRSEKICSVSWSHPEQQGCNAHVQRYRNSPVMHEQVPDSWKPALFQAGLRMPFPPPTKRLRNPRIREL